MNYKRLMRLAIIAAAALAVSSIVWVKMVTAQQGGEGGAGEAGAAGEAGFGGGGGSGGRGGAGGGGGSFVPKSGGGIAAHGEYVYVLHQGRLYQYAAYDLTLVKKIKLDAAGAKKRMSRRAGGFGGGGGEGGADGGQGGDGGGFAFMQGGGSSEGVAAFGDFVYVLQSARLHKLAADGLISVKSVTLKFDE